MEIVNEKTVKVIRIKYNITDHDQKTEVEDDSLNQHTTGAGLALT